MIGRIDFWAFVPRGGDGGGGGEGGGGQDSARDVALGETGGRGYSTGSSSSGGQGEGQAAASTPSYSGSFSSAFAAARSDLGPGQTFSWGGNEYSTSVAGEDPALDAAISAQRGGTDDRSAGGRNLDADMSVGMNATAGVVNTPAGPQVVDKTAAGTTRGGYTYDVPSTADLSAIAQTISAPTSGKAKDMTTEQFVDDVLSRSPAYRTTNEDTVVFPGLSIQMTSTDALGIQKNADGTYSVIAPDGTVLAASVRSPAGVNPNLAATFQSAYARTGLTGAALESEVDQMYANGLQVTAPAGSTGFAVVDINGNTVARFDSYPTQAQMENLSGSLGISSVSVPAGTNLVVDVDARQGLQGTVVDNSQRLIDLNQDIDKTDVNVSLVSKEEFDALFPDLAGDAGGGQTGGGTPGGGTPGGGAQAEETAVVPVSAEDVQAIVNDAMANNPNMTTEEVSQIVSDALAGQNNLSAEDVKNIVNDALSGMNNLSTQDVQDIVDAASEAAQKQVSDLETALTDRIQELEDAGVERDEAMQTALSELSTQLGTTEENLLDQLDTTREDLLSEIGTQVGDLQTALTDRIQELEDAGVERDEAISTAVSELATQLGTTEESILTELGTQIGSVQEQIDTRYQELVDAGVDAQQALSDAINTVATDLGTTRQDLLDTIGTTEANLQSYVGDVEAGLRGEIATVSSVIGRPPREVTQADIDALTGMLSGGDVSNPSLAQQGYDVNGDGQLTAADIEIMRRFMLGENVDLSPGSMFGDGTGIWAGQSLSRDTTGESAVGYTGTAAPSTPGAGVGIGGLRPGAGTGGTGTGTGGTGTGGVGPGTGGTGTGGTGTGLGDGEGPGTGTGTGTGTGVGPGTGPGTGTGGGIGGEGPPAAVECPPGYKKVYAADGSVSCQLIDPSSAPIGVRPTIAPYLQTGPGPSYNPYEPVPYQPYQAQPQPLPAPGYTPYRPGIAGLR